MIAYKLVYIAMCYVVGSILFAELSMKIVKKQSLYEVSKNHNPGVSNAFIYGGKFCGTIALIGDLAKGIIPTYAYVQIFGERDLWIAFVMLALALGHAFSIFHHFKGGMCITVSFGMFAGLFPIWIPVTLLIVTYLSFLALRKFSNSLLSIFTYIIESVIIIVCTFGGIIEIPVCLGVVAVSMLICVRMWGDLSVEEQVRLKKKRN